MNSIRPRQTAIAALVCAFALLAQAAYASHYRYGYISWERDLSHPVAGEVKVTVTVEAGARWTYTWPSATVPATSPMLAVPNRCINNVPVCCAGVPSLSSTFADSCPNQGSLIQFVGSNGIQFNKAVRVTARNGLNLITPLQIAAGGFLSMDMVTTQVVPSEDTFYGRSVFTIVFLEATATPASPLSLSWTNNARIGTVLDGNANQNWTLRTNLAFSGGFPTKSPKSQSSAVIQVMAGRNNVVNLPSVAFDNMHNRWRIATTAESSLPAPVPLSPSLFSLNSTTGEVNFTPRTTGLYSVQFMLTSFDPNTGVEKSTVPLDVLFQAIVPSNYTSTLVNTDAQSTFTATVGEPFSYTMRSTLTPNHPQYTTTINNTALPPGAFTTGGTCTGTATCDKVFHWTPTVTSTGGVVCYTATVTSGSTVITNASQQCITVNLNPLETRLTAYATEAVAGGGPLVLSAKLERVYQTAPLPGRTVTFTYDANPTNPPWIGTASAVTDVNGIATATVTTVGAVMPPSPYTATFNAVANEYLASSAGSNMVSIKAATTSMRTPTFDSQPTIGYPIMARAQLDRQFTDGGPLALGADVQFTLSGPGVSETKTANTGTTGIAIVQFDTPLPNAGPFSVQASFSGNDALLPNGDGTPTTATASATARRRTKLAIQPVAPLAVGQTVPLTVTLSELPALTTPLAGRSVRISGAFTESPIAAVTNASGAVTINVTFPAVGNAAVLAAYTPLAAETNDNATAGDETDSVTVAVARAATQLLLPALPQYSPLNQPLTVSATLMRTTAPSSAVGGAMVIFELFFNSNKVMELRPITNASGIATTTFPANLLSTVGIFRVEARFDETATLSRATASSETITTTAAATTLSSAPISTTSGQNTVLSATLTSAGSPVPNQTITFTAVGGPVIGIAMTGPTGVASLAITAGNVFNGQYRADFAGAAQYSSSFSTAAYIVAAIPTTLTIAPVTTVTGQNTTFSATLTAAGSPLSGQTVAFSTVGGAALGNAVTNIAGVASITVAAGPVFTGQYRADFVAAGNYAASNAAAAYTVSAIQTALEASPVTTIAGQETAITATLTAAGAPLANQPVSFSVVGMGHLGTAMTGPTGVATVYVTIPLAGSGSYQADFGGAPTYAASQAVGTYLAGAATATLELVFPPTSGSVGQSLTVSAALARVSAPAGPVGGRAVLFTLTAPGGSVQQQSTVTSADGRATVSFPALSVRGMYSVSASFAGDGALVPTTSAAATVTVSQELSVSVTTPGGVAGGSIPFTATITAAPGNTPVTDPLIVTFSAGAHTAQATVSNGIATGSITFPSSGPQTVTASIQPQLGYAGATSIAIPFTVTSAAVSLSALELNEVSFVGDSAVIRTTLTRASAPIGIVTGATISFSVTGNAGNPGGATQQTFTAETDSNGMATITVPMSTRGGYTVNASFAGSSSLAAGSRSGSFQVFQKTAVIVNTSYGVATDETLVSASLVSLPDNVPVAGQTLTFNFNNVVATVSSQTDANGVATAFTNFPVPGTNTVTVSFSNVAGFFVDAQGNPLPSTASGNIILEQVQTALSAPNVPAAPLVGDSITVTSVLTRITAPAGTMAGRAIAFTLNGTPLETALTDSNGVASATIALTARGTNIVTASYMGTAAETPSTNSTTVAVRQRTQVTAAQQTVGTAGVATTISGALLYLPGGFAAGQSITFSHPDGVPATSAAITNEFGVARTVVVFPTGGSFPVTATFAAQHGDYTNRNGEVAPETSSTIAVVNKATAQLTAVVAPPAAFVGQSVSLQTTLSRVTPPGNGPVAGAVNFTITQPGGSTQVIAGQAGANGVASVSFVPSVRGVFSVTASFDGDASLNATTSAATSSTAYQRTTLSAAATGGNAGAPMTVTATLTSAPGGAGIDGQPVQFTFEGNGAPASVTAMTVGGVATIGVTPALPGTLSVRATFENAAGFFTNSAGAVPAAPEVADATLEVAAATTSLSTVTAPVNALIGAPIAVSATLSRLDAIALPAGLSVSFTVTMPDGTTAQLSGVTNAAGVATGSFMPAMRGAHTVRAEFAGTAALVTSSSAVSTTSVYQRTSLAVAPASGSAQRPTTISATLTAVPGGAPVADKVVAFSFSDGSWATATTNAEGVAQVTVTFAAVGNYASTATFTDAAGFYADSTGAFPVTATTGTGTVEVTNNPPAFTPPSNITSEATGANGAVVTFAAAGTDVEDGAINAICAPVSGSTFAIGTTTVSCTVTDIASATASGSFTVTVADTTAPVLTLPTIAPAFAGAANGNVVSFATSALDIVDGARDVTCTPASGSTFPIATTTVNCSTSDSRGNTSTGAFDISITNTAPTIDDLPNLSGEATGAAGRSFTFASTGSDAEQGALTPVCTAASGTFPIGTTTVSCTVTDIAGYTATDSFTITVVDTTAPAVTVSSITVEQTSPAGATGNFTFSASDIVDGALTPVCTPAAGTTFARGTTPVTCSVTDANGNTGTASGSVTVVDTVKPVVTYTGNAGTYTVDQTINITCSATDSGSGIASSTCANVAGPAHTFTVGVNTRTATATDVAGNTTTATISFTVTVPPAAVGNVITQFFDSPSEAAKANHTLNQATSAPNANARAAHLNKLKKDIEKEIGKTLTAAEAATLISLLNNLY